MLGPDGTFYSKVYTPDDAHLDTFDPDETWTKEPE